MLILPPLPYEYNSLEPYIATEIMKLHHQKHHQAYINNANKAMNELAIHTPDNISLQNLADYIIKLPTETKNKPLFTILQNNIGGHINHTLFWCMMTPDNNKKQYNHIKDFFNKYSFYDRKNFKNIFIQSALSVFGSGWTWLIFNKNTQQLEIKNYTNQDTPYFTAHTIPILGVDVWEHAYYLQYFNKRDEYLSAWWNTINWEYVFQQCLNL